MLVLAGTSVVLFSFQMKEKTTTIKKNPSAGRRRRRHPIRKKENKTPPLLSAHPGRAQGEWKLEALLSQQSGCNFSCGSGQILPRAKRRVEPSRAQPRRVEPRLPASPRPLGSCPGDTRGERVTPAALGKPRIPARESRGFNCGKRARCPLSSVCFAFVYF